MVFFALRFHMFSEIFSHPKMEDKLWAIIPTRILLQIHINEDKQIGFPMISFPLRATPANPVLIRRDFDCYFPLGVDQHFFQ